MDKGYDASRVYAECEARDVLPIIPLKGVNEQQLADAAQLSSLADETPEGRSIVVLAKEK